MTKPAPRFAHAGPDTSLEMNAWLHYLITEKRVAENTVEAYVRDMEQFFEFLFDHLAGAASLQDLAQLNPRDFRAFLASRRSQGASNRTVARNLSAIRSLFRFLEKKGTLTNPGLSAITSPKISHSVPKPLSRDAAKRLASPDPVVAGASEQKWILATRCRRFHPALWLRFAYFRSFGPYIERSSAKTGTSGFVDYRQGRQDAPGSGVAGSA